MAAMFIKKQNVAETKMSSSGSSSGSTTTKSTPSPTSNRGNILKIVAVLTLLGIVVFVGLYLEANPKACTKKQCSTVTKMPENALVVVASNLAVDCDPKEKSRRVKEIIETTLEEINYA